MKAKTRRSLYLHHSIYNIQQSYSYTPHVMNCQNLPACHRRSKTTRCQVDVGDNLDHPRSPATAASLRVSKIVLVSLLDHSPLHSVTIIRGQLPSRLPRLLKFHLQSIQPILFCTIFGRGRGRQHFPRCCPSSTCYCSWVEGRTGSYRCSCGRTRRW